MSTGWIFQVARNSQTRDLGTRKRTDQPAYVTPQELFSNLEEEIPPRGAAELNAHCFEHK
ncbi:hypothetical protein PCANC_11756 [Puccinia coronata f. sp. avenae]|uniref:Uncharacterized protein n=1 Tax=Puccinia coronata f. sp. avenae TaxID=200324 RepID=A0A2N5UY06_9BASI|nr:hypothetical protein PCANC_11756 [Puccinia coronata f. sp. avenae]